MHKTTKKPLEKHLIFTIEYDASTDAVMDWLHFYGETVERKNSVQVAKAQQTIRLKKTQQSYKSVWYRKILGVSKKKWMHKEDMSDTIFEHNRNAFNATITEEAEVVNNFFYSNVRGKKILCDFRYIDVNKLTVLQLATELNIDIPDTFICATKSELASFMASHPKGIINKSIDNHLFFDVYIDNKRQPMANYTEEITTAILTKLPEAFRPSLFQEKLAKEYEIRSFYLDGKFYSMAIFSQNNQKTTVDFRRYDKKTPNRTVPYQLPKSVEANLHKLMQSLCLNTGSIDIVKTTNGRFVFLEVNPAGQYGMTSYPCNYYLEKQIATFLMNS